MSLTNTQKIVLSHMAKNPEEKFYLQSGTYGVTFGKIEATGDPAIKMSKWTLVSLINNRLVIPKNANIIWGITCNGYYKISQRALDKLKRVNVWPT